MQSLRVNFGDHLQTVITLHEFHHGAKRPRKRQLHSCQFGGTACETYSTVWNQPATPWHQSEMALARTKEYFYRTSPGKLSQIYKKWMYIVESQEAGDQNDLKEASENWKLEIIKNLATWKLKTRKSKDRETEPLTCFKGSQMLKNPSAHMFSLRLNFCCFWVFSQPDNDGKPTRKAVLRFSDPWWRWKRPLCNGRRN